jgi:hypothetical protein
MEPTTFGSTTRAETFITNHNDVMKRQPVEQLKGSYSYRLGGYVQDAIYIKKLNALALVLSTAFDRNYYDRSPQSPANNSSRIAFFDFSKMAVTFSCCPKYSQKAFRLIGPIISNRSMGIEFECSEANSCQNGGINRDYITRNVIDITRILCKTELGLVNIKAFDNFTRPHNEVHLRIGPNFSRQILHSSANNIKIVQTAPDIKEVTFKGKIVAAIRCKQSVELNGTIAKFEVQKNIVIYDLKKLTKKSFVNSDVTTIAVSDECESLFIAYKDRTIHKFFYNTNKRELVIKSRFPEINMLFQRRKFLAMIYRSKEESAVEIIHLKSKATVYLKKYNGEIHFAKILKNKLIYCIGQSIMFVHLKSNILI